MLLAVAGRLLQAQQRPGEGMFSGVGRGVGKAITEDFPVIKKLSLEDRAARLKGLKDVLGTGEGAKYATSYFDTVEKRNIPKVALATVKSEPGRYIDRIEPRSFTLLQDIPEIDKKKGDTYYMDPAMYYDQVLNPKTRIPNFLQKVVKYGEESETTKLQYKEEQALNLIDTGLEEKAQTTAIKYNALDESLNQLSSIIKDPHTQLGSSGSIAKVLDNTRATIQNLNDLVFGKSGTSRQNAENLDNIGREQASELFQENINNLEDKDGRNVKDYFIKKYGETQGNDFLNRIMEYGAQSAKHKAVFTEVLYTIAKFREEGGRFSVSDIELAALSLGATGGSKVQAMSALEALRENFVRRAYSEITTSRGVLVKEKYKGLLPKDFDKLSKLEQNTIMQDLYLDQDPMRRSFYGIIFNRYNKYGQQAIDYEEANKQQRKSVQDQVTDAIDEILGEEIK